MELLDGKRNRVDFLDKLGATISEIVPPPDPVIKMRVLPGAMPASSSIRRRNSRTFSGCRVS